MDSYETRSPTSPTTSETSSEFEQPLNPTPVPETFDLASLTGWENEYLKNVEPLPDLAAVSMQVAMLTMGLRKALEALEALNRNG